MCVPDLSLDSPSGALYQLQLQSLKLHRLWFGNDTPREHNLCVDCQRKDGDTCSSFRVWVEHQWFILRYFYIMVNSQTTRWWILLLMNNCVCQRGHAAMMIKGETSSNIL